MTARVTGGITRYLAGAERTITRVLVPSFGLSPDRALLLALHRLEHVGALPSWPLYCLDTRERETPAYSRRATLRGTFRKER